jgi:hypothetical protein
MVGLNVLGQFGPGGYVDDDHLGMSEFQGGGSLGTRRP